MSDTLAKWGNKAKQYVRMTSENVVLGVDADEVIIHEPDTVRRKAIWSDTQWIVARILETGAETVERNFERTKDLLLAGERLAALCRGVMESKDYVARGITLARCLDAYDAAKRKAKAPSVYERLRAPTATPEEAPAPLEPQTTQEGWQKAPSIPEPETEALYQVFYCWRERLKLAGEDLNKVKASHEGEDPNQPCPEDLVRAYTRVFKVQNVCAHLEAAIREQIGEHMSTLCSDDSGDFPTDIRFMHTVPAEQPQAPETSATP